MRKPLPNFSTRGNVLFFVTLGLIVVGFGVAFAGGICMENYGDETAWAVALFLVGLLIAIVSVTAMVLVGYVERCRGIRQDDERAARISSDTFYGGGTFITFTKDGIHVEREEGEPFAESETLVPYQDVSLFRCMERKGHKSKGKELDVLQVPVRYFAAEEEQTDFASCALTLSPRLDDTVKKFGVSVKDYRDIPAKNAKRLPVRAFCGAKNKRVDAILYGLIAVLFLGLLALSAVCWAGLLEGGVTGGFGVLGANFYLVALLSAITWFGRRNYCVLYDRGIRFTSGFTNSAFFVWEQVEKIQKIDVEEKSFVAFDLGYMGIAFLDRKGLYLFLRETFPEKCTEDEAWQNKNSERENRKNRESNERL